VSQIYTAHYDNKQGCKRRAASFMMCLTDVDAGGATHFPKALPLTVRDRNRVGKTGSVVAVYQYPSSSCSASSHACSCLVIWPLYCCVMPGPPRVRRSSSGQSRGGHWYSGGDCAGSVIITV
jgi:hypothetical protein